MILAVAGRVAPAAALAVLLSAGPAGAQTRAATTTFTCQGGGAMVVDLAPAANGQVVMSIRAGLAASGDQTPAPGTCATADAGFQARAQQAAASGPATLRLTTRQPLVLAVQVAADQSPRVTLSSQRSDARAEQTLQLYDSAIQGRMFTVTARAAPRSPLDLSITGSASR